MRLNWTDYGVLICVLMQVSIGGAAWILTWSDKMFWAFAIAAGLIVLAGSLYAVWKAPDLPETDEHDL